MMNDKRFVLLSDEDNVLVCCGKVAAGEKIIVEQQEVEMATEITVGHKIARTPLEVGVKIIKYGAPIGSTVKPVGFAEHVHIHNMKSDYMASYTRQAKVGE